MTQRVYLYSIVFPHENPLRVDSRALPDALPFTIEGFGLLCPAPLNLPDFTLPTHAHPAAFAYPMYFHLHPQLYTEDSSLVFRQKMPHVHVHIKDFSLALDLNRDDIMTAASWHHVLTCKTSQPSDTSPFATRISQHQPYLASPLVVPLFQNDTLNLHLLKRMLYTKVSCSELSRQWLIHALKATGRGLLPTEIRLFYEVLKTCAVLSPQNANTICCVDSMKSLDAISYGHSTTASSQSAHPDELFAMPGMPVTLFRFSRALSYISARCHSALTHYAVLHEKIESPFAVEFKDKALLRRAFTHRSFISVGDSEAAANDLDAKFDADYEIFEFLGDALLEIAVADRVLKACAFLQGQGIHVDDATAFRWMRWYTKNGTLELALHLHDWKIDSMLLYSGQLRDRQGKVLSTKADHDDSNVGDGPTSETAKPSQVLCNCFEALLAAIFLDSGGSFTRVTRVVDRLLFMKLDCPIETGSQRITRHVWTKILTEVLVGNQQQSDGIDFLSPVTREWLLQTYRSLEPGRYLMSLAHVSWLYPMKDLFQDNPEFTLTRVDQSTLSGLLHESMAFRFPFYPIERRTGRDHFHRYYLPSSSSTSSSSTPLGSASSAAQTAILSGASTSIAPTPQNGPSRIELAFSHAKLRLLGEAMFKCATCTWIYFFAEKENAQIRERMKSIQNRDERHDCAEELWDVAKMTWVFHRVTQQNIVRAELESAMWSNRMWKHLLPTEDARRLFETEWTTGNASRVPASAQSEALWFCVCAVFGTLFIATGMTQDSNLLFRLSRGDCPHCGFDHAVGNGGFYARFLCHYLWSKKEHWQAAKHFDRGLSKHTVLTDFQRLISDAPWQYKIDQAGDGYDFRCVIECPPPLAASCGFADSKSVVICEAVDRVQQLAERKCIATMSEVLAMVRRAGYESLLEKRRKTMDANFDIPIEGYPEQWSSDEEDDFEREACFLRLHPAYRLQDTKDYQTGPWQTSSAEYAKHKFSKHEMRQAYRDRLDRAAKDWLPRKGAEKHLTARILLHEVVPFHNACTSDIDLVFSWDNFVAWRAVHGRRARTQRNENKSVGSGLVAGIAANASVEQQPENLAVQS
jgi:dsRNA-specific ribonuclease